VISWYILQQTFRLQMFESSSDINIIMI